MKKVLVVMVVLLAAIVPSQQVMANGLDKVLAGLKVIQAFSGVSQSQLRKIGKNIDKGLVTKYSATTEGLERVQGVVNRLEPDPKKRPEAKILDTSEEQAMATPGYIYITAGLLSKYNDQQLAGVLSHELGHLELGHVKKAVKRSRTAQGLSGALTLADASKDLQTGVGIASVLSLLSYSREEEYEADKWGVEHAAKAGYNPQGLADALSKLDKKGGAEFLSTHPDLTKRVKRASKLAEETEIGTVGKVQAAPEVRNHLARPERRIFVKFEFAGDSGRLQEWFPRYFQLKVVEDGQVEVEAWDQDWDTITQAQDKINDSGRYSRSSSSQVPKGRMEAPTDYYQITVDTSVNRLNVGANVRSSWFGGTDVQVQDYVSLKIGLTVQPWDIRTGRLQRGWIVTGAAKGLDGVEVSNSRSWRGQNFRVYLSNIEKTLEGKAAREAVENFLRQFGPQKDEMAAAPSVTGTFLLHPEAGPAIRIEITSGKHLAVGDRIVFYQNDQPIAEYEVVAIKGRDIHIQTIYERFRPTTEPFKIL